MTEGRGASGTPVWSAANMISRVLVISARRRQPATQRQGHLVAVQRPAQAVGPLPPPQGPQLAMIGLHVAVERPRVVGNLDVDRGQAKVVPLRFAANVHPHPPA